MVIIDTATGAFSYHCAFFDLSMSLRTNDLVLKVRWNPLEKEIGPHTCAQAISSERRFWSLESLVISQH